MLENFITAKQARKKSESAAMELENQADITHVYALIERTCELGFNKIVLTILPEMLAYVIESFPDYRIEEVPYREPLHPDKLNILIIW